MASLDGRPMTRTTKLVWLLASVGVIAAALATARARPLLIYNPSSSVPTGFYVRAPGAPRLGDFVIVRAAVASPEEAAQRDYADPTDRFIKRLAAVAGNTICASGSQVEIDGERIITRQETSALGRPLPTWSGCRTLPEGEVLLLGDTPDSFDGRYWGPISVRDIDGPWRRVGER